MDFKLAFVFRLCQGHCVFMEKREHDIAQYCVKCGQAQHGFEAYACMNCYPYANCLKCKNNIKTGFNS